jgi:hypothetical protein
VNDLAYLFCPVRKPGAARKFRKPWSGPFQIMEWISDLNYWIESKKGKQSMVHVNRLKPCVCPEAFWLQKETNTRRRVTFGKVTIIPDEREEQENRRNTLIPVYPTEIVELQAENLTRIPLLPQIITTLFFFFGSVSLEAELKLGLFGGGW